MCTFTEKKYSIPHKTIFQSVELSEDIYSIKPTKRKEIYTIKDDLVYKIPEMFRRNPNHYDPKIIHYMMALYEKACYRRTTLFLVRTNVQIDLYPITHRLHPH